MTGHRRITNAVEFDEWLARRTPEDVAMARAVVGQSFSDQLDAASRDMRDLAEEVLNKKAVYVEPDAMSGLMRWMRLGMIAAILAWSRGETATCEHRPDIHRPQPVWAAAWKPGLVVCELCTQQLRVHGVANKTCDGCGHVCEGKPDDPIYPVSLLSGAFCYMAGTCQGCYDDLPRQP